MTSHLIKTNFTVSIEVAKSKEEVFSYLTNDVSKFWPEELEGNCSQPGDEFVFRSGESHYSKNKVIELVPNKKVVWLVTDSIRKTDNYKWTGSKMIFELTPDSNDGTRLQFTYDGVVLENESERLAQICDLVIKQNLYSLIESFAITIEVVKSPQHIFNCLKEVSKWWSKDFEGSSEELNDEFIIHHPGQHYSKQKLVETIPKKKIVWLVTDSKLDWLEKDTDEWTNTKMVFEIEAKTEKSLLYFRHEGLSPEKECYDRCAQGWSMVINQRLFDFITEGKTI